MLLLNNAFSSIDGEVNTFGQGRITYFIRLQGCNLNCWYCDTDYARAMSDQWVLEKTPGLLLDMTKNYKKITITGGEPLLQRKELLRFVKMAAKAGKDITIETNGSLPLGRLKDFAYFVVDYKLGSSGMNEAMNPEAFIPLGPSDYVKFVIYNESDFIEAVNVMDNYWGRSCLVTPTFAFSPVHGKLDPKLLHFWITKDYLQRYYPISLNVQLHKILNFD